MPVNDDSRTRADAKAEVLRIKAELAKELASGGPAYKPAILLGISIGALFAVGGVALALLGVSGAINLVLESSGLSARLTNASPGVVIAAMGMFIIWRYKPRVEHDVKLGDSHFIHGMYHIDVPLRRLGRRDDDDDFSSKGSASSPVSR